MADNKVRKGFTTYLFILLLLIVAAFLVILVVMFFSPFKNILGFQYYSYNFDKTITNASGGDPITLESLKEINIDCNTADIEIIRDTTVDNGGVRITNYASGFASASANTNFDYKVYYSDENSVLNIEVNEPDGFLKFNKNITIYLLVSAKLNYNLSQTQININNTSGNVFIGNNEKLEENEEEIGISSILDINNLYITKNGGKVKFRSQLENNFQNIFISTNGSVTADLATINLSNKLIINSKEGRFEFKDVNYVGNDKDNSNIILNIVDGIFNAKKLSGNINLNLKSGYLTINNVVGSINANNTINQMNDAEIEIQNLDGNLSFPYANKADIKIENMTLDSQAYIHGTSGNITINSLNGKAWIETTSGDVYIHSYNDDMEVKTISGNIDIIYEVDSINEELKFYSNSGKIDLKLKSNLAFILRIYDNENSYRNDKNINFLLQDKPFENPLVINNGTKYITIKSEGKIDIGLININ